jgi:hypothetical protein
VEIVMTKDNLVMRSMSEAFGFAVEEMGDGFIRANLKLS